MARMIDRIVDGARRSLADSRGRPARVAAAPTRAGDRDAAAEPSRGALDAMSDGAAISPPSTSPAEPTAASSQFATAAQRLASWLSGPDAASAEPDADAARPPAPLVAATAKPAAGTGEPRSPGVGRPAAAPVARGARDAAGSSPDAIAPPPRSDLPRLPGADHARDPARPAEPVTWTAQPAPVPAAPAAALRRPTPPAEAVGAVLAGARIESLPGRGATGSSLIAAMPSAPPAHEHADRAPRSLEAPAVERDPPTGPERSAHAAPASAIIEASPVWLATASRSPADALSRPAPPPAPELVIEHVDIRVITEPPAPPPAPERRAPSTPTVTRSGAWSPAARHYLGRWS